MLLAHCAKQGDDWEFHGEPVSGMCQVTLCREDDRQDRAPRHTLLVAREATKDTIRAMRDDLLPGYTLVFAYPGADPWPLHTARVAPGREIEGAPVNFGALPPTIENGIETTYHTDPLGTIVGMEKRRIAPHPADDLLGPDERS